MYYGFDVVIISVKLFADNYHVKILETTVTKRTYMCIYINFYIYTGLSTLPRKSNPLSSLKQNVTIYHFFITFFLKLMKYFTALLIGSAYCNPYTLL